MFLFLYKMLQVCGIGNFCTRKSLDTKPTPFMFHVGIHVHVYNQNHDPHQRHLCFTWVCESQQMSKTGIDRHFPSCIVFKIYVLNSTHVQLGTKPKLGEIANLCTSTESRLLLPCAVALRICEPKNLWAMTNKQSAASRKRFLILAFRSLCWCKTSGAHVKQPRSRQSHVRLPVCKLCFENTSEWFVAHQSTQGRWLEVCWIQSIVITPGHTFRVYTQTCETAMRALTSQSRCCSQELEPIRTREQEISGRRVLLAQLMIPWCA